MAVAATTAVLACSCVFVVVVLAVLLSLLNGHQTLLSLSVGPSYALPKKLIPGTAGLLGHVTSILGEGECLGGGDEGEARTGDTLTMFVPLRPGVPKFGKLGTVLASKPVGAEALPRVILLSVRALDNSTNTF